MSILDPALTPVATPPPGIQSNFIDPPSLMSAVIVGTIVVQLSTLPFIFTRAFVNITTRTVLPEDILSYLAYGAFIAQNTLIIINSTHGMARHTWDVSLATIVPGTRMYNIIFICYTVSGGFAKACVFLQLKRIFTTVLKGLVYWVIVGSLTVNAIAYTCFLFLYLFTCWPREKIWSPFLPGRCMDSNTLHTAIGGLNTFSDIEAFLVPIFAIWQMQMELRKKLEVLAVFAVGLFAVATGCVGMYYRVLVLTGPDVTWSLTQTAIVCMAELSVVIIVGCCPYISRVIRQLRDKNTSRNNHRLFASEASIAHAPNPRNAPCWKGDIEQGVRAQNKRIVSSPTDGVI
ncbi:hypothetical protein K504DRAFT_474066 [Pleomassaria siparia CBS 279.74]|uniref:Rhodopsin domain-containing protein n=1 Tax=Pleomassaria siparia CBS 279.74 TaxID=1314801 RepID=A0A6G1JSB3_9PLEO|nr:hypothetical protein K504DRAFT_474066 [Pleomassaria siparia CBS 279.74]